MSLETFFASEVRLPTAPVSAARILEAVRSSDESSQSLARVIGADPALSAKLLSVANSPLYGQPGQVTRIEQAITLLGLNAVKNIALSFVVIDALGSGGRKRFDLERFVKRAVTGAVAAELISLRLGRQCDESFAAGLLQDVGILVFALVDFDTFSCVLDEQEATGEPLCSIEKRWFGTDHQEIGAELLRLWGLPEPVHVPIRFHHCPTSAPPQHGLLAEVLSLADALATLYHGNQGAQTFGQLRSTLARHFADGQEIDRLIDEVASRAEELLDVYDISDREIRPYSQLLQEANEELSRLNLSYAQLVVELKQAKAQAERLAAELLRANAKLRELADRDGLTGLYNHRRFQEALGREVSEAVRYGRPSSLVLLDLDNFKRVNDLYGHLTGDEVLRNAAELIQSIVRKSDVVARYGGEEFAVMLPETRSAEALAMAERVRRGIESMETRVNGSSIRVTISGGICGIEKFAAHATPRMLIDAADRALYSAKNGGRNRIVVAR